MPVLSSLVSVRSRYHRAVNITADSHDTQALHGFCVTPLVADALHRLLSNIESPQGARSFMLFGPYGAGKSAFALFLCSLFSTGPQEASSAYHALDKVRSDLGRRFSKICSSAKPWLCVPVTARRRPIGQIILEGMREALETLPDDSARQHMARRLSQALAQESWRDSAIVLALVDAVRQLAAERARSGLLLVVDETGKSLEYALQDKEGGDIYLFQTLAEHANRALDVPFLLMTVQHQYFEGYTELGNTILRYEWAKVQERFETIHFNDQLASSLHMLRHVLEHLHPLPQAAKAVIDATVQRMLATGAELPPGMTVGEFVEICHQAWPLHPSVVLVLPLIFRRLAQNERSLFSYLSSQEPYGFQEHCARDAVVDHGFVRLCNIGDYLLVNMAAILVQRPAARVLLESMEHDGAALTSVQQKLLRTVGVLNVLGHNSPLKPTKTLLATVVEGGDIDATLHDLRRRELLSYRQWDQTYRLWEGGSIDLEARLKEERRQQRFDGASFLELVRAHVPQRPLVARKHTLQSGAYRFFALEYASTALPSVERPPLSSSCEAGKILVLLPMGNEAALEQAVCDATRNALSLVVAMPSQLDMLRQPAIELDCLRRVEKNTPDLRGDRRALREFATLLADCERRVRQSAALLLDPRSAPYGNACRWFWNGEEQKVRRPADVTRLLSNICDSIYSHAPRIRNELVARPMLSSAATAARTILMKRMLSASDRAALGIEGFPPERSMYESVLRATELHRQDAQGTWHLHAPAPDSSLHGIWCALEVIIFKEAGKAVPLERVFNNLTQPPYGVPEGLLPVLLLAFYLTRSSELFLYREGSFLPHLDESSIELLQRRPDLFGISGVCLKGELHALVQRYAEGLHVEPTVPAIVERLYTALQQLPAITQHTAQLRPQRGKALRDIFRAGRSPERLLFEELPKAFGMSSLLDVPEANAAETFACAMRESMGELLNHAPQVRNHCRDILLRCCGLATGHTGWNTFVERARFLARRVRHGGIVAVLDRACRVENKENSTIDGVLGLVHGRAFHRWNDGDILAFEASAHGIGEQFQRLWDTHGASFLSVKEQTAKQHVCNELAKHVNTLRGAHSARILAEALRDMLRQVEESAREEPQ